jgi:hypothetical protein
MTRKTASPERDARLCKTDTAARLQGSVHAMRKSRRGISQGPPLLTVGGSTFQPRIRIREYSAPTGRRMSTLRGSPGITVT